MEKQTETQVTDVATLTLELQRLNSGGFIRMHNSWLRLITVQFVKGLALGLGTVVGATLLVSMLVLILSNIDFLPIIGEWAAEIARQMESPR